MPATLFGGFPCHQPPKDAKTGAFIHGNDSNAKHSVKYFVGVP